MFVYEMRPFLVGLVCCQVCNQLESSLVIQGSLGRSANSEYASYASRRREGGVCREGQGRTSLPQYTVLLVKKIVKYSVQKHITYYTNFP